MLKSVIGKCMANPTNLSRSTASSFDPFQKYFKASFLCSFVAHSKRVLATYLLQFSRFRPAFVCGVERNWWKSRTFKTFGWQLQTWVLNEERWPKQLLQFLKRGTLSLTEIRRVVSRRFPIFNGFRTFHFPKKKTSSQTRFVFGAKFWSTSVHFRKGPFSPVKESGFTRNFPRINRYVLDAGQFRARGQEPVSATKSRQETGQKVSVNRHRKFSSSRISQQKGYHRERISIAKRDTLLTEINLINIQNKHYMVHLSKARTKKWARVNKWWDGPGRAERPRRISPSNHAH